MSDKIKIQTITPANSDGNDLKGYYFLPAGNGTYNFYSSNNNLLASSLESNSSFQVEVDGKDFTITIDSISDSAASGDWSDMGVEGVPGSGTFQAQAGGTGEPDPKPEKSAYSARS